ncbi:MAG: Ig-like domain-containing protein [Acidobacteriota bacterium]
MPRSTFVLSFISSVLIACAAWAMPTTDLYRIDDLSPTPTKALSDIAGAVDEVAITLDTTVLDRAPTALELPLPDGRRVRATRTYFDATADTLAWSGPIDRGDGRVPGYLHLIDRGDTVSGILNLGAEHYQIVAAPGGHRLVRVELAHGVCALETEADALGLLELLEPHPTTDVADPSAGGLDAAAVQLDLAAQDDTLEAGATKATITIDVLAVYPSVFTGGAETGVRNFIQNSVSIANGVFANNGINTRYRLVAMERLTGASQPPATGLIGGMNWMAPRPAPGQDPDDAAPQEILDLREEYAADMVALFVPLSYDDDAACGVATLPEADGDIRFFGGAFGTRAFTVNRDGCGLNDFTLAHELGHNMAMRHNDYTENTSSATHSFPNGRGHTLSATPWRDIANGTLNLNVPGDFTTGYHFRPSVDGYIVGFGGLFNGTKNVQLWEKATGQLLCTSPTICQIPVTASNSWSYSELIRPIAVQAGIEYTVAGYSQGNGSFYSNVIPFPRTSGAITILGTTVATGNQRPTDTRVDFMYGQFDIQFVPTADLAATVLGCSRTSDDITNEVCNRIPYYSDPNRVVGGYTTGTATRDNDHVARVQSAPYAGFRTNNAPQCQNDNLSTPAGTPLSIPFGTLLGNDSDPNNDPLRVSDYDRTTAQGGSNDSGHAVGFNYTPPSPSFTGLDWFTYTISDRPDGHGAAQFDTCTVFVTVQGNEQPMGEVGVVTNLTHVPRTVILNRSYMDPIVIAQTVSQNGTDTSVVRITSVQSDRFTFFVDEAPDRDGPHTNETVGYLVVEAGAWTLADGSTVRAGKRVVSTTVGHLVTNQWTTVNFGGTFQGVPLAFSQVQTNNDPSWVKTRHLSVATSSMRLSLEEEEASSIPHGAETVGWIAFEPGSGSWSGRPYRASRTGNSVTDAFSTITWSAIGSPRLFAAMSTYDGGHNASLRYTALTTSSAQVRVEEDTTFDTETAHTTEVVDYLVLGGSGTLSATPQ